MTDPDHSRNARLVVVPDPDGDAQPVDLAPEQAANPARIYDYLLGGKDNYVADRLAAQHAIAAMPEVRNVARANRRFLVRAVRFAAEQGIVHEATEDAA